MPKTPYDYDLIILGGGSAGIVSGVLAGALGLRVLLVEKTRMGGECLNTGCVPSKALLHAARVAHTVRTADQFGFPSLALSREQAAGVFRWVRGRIQAVEKADATTDLLSAQGVAIRLGAAHFIDPHTLQVEDDRVSAAHFILATGSSPVRPQIPGLDEAGFLTNQTVFDLDEVPPALLVVGAGPIGVEMAQAFARLGSRVTLVGTAARLLPRDDAELAVALAEYLAAEGVEIRLRTAVARVERQDGRLRAVLAGDGAGGEIVCDRVLIGIGRVPNIDGLALEAAGVACDEKRVLADDRFRTTAPHIFVCGDLLGDHQFSHMAEYEAKTVVRNIVFPGTSRASFRLDPWATFTDPELVHLGLTEEQAREQGLSFDVFRQPFAQNDRALCEGDDRGLVKVLTQGLGGRILGVHILGPRAAELSHEWMLAMQHGHSIRDIADLIHIYPTLGMACQHAAQRWYERKAGEPLIRAALNAYVKAIRPHEKEWALGAVGAALLGAGIGLGRRARSRPDDPEQPDWHEKKENP